eukprot:5228142-Amphidinium_carterae.1
MNKNYRIQNYSSSTLSDRRKLSTCGFRVGKKYQRATLTTLQIQDMATTTSTRKYTTPLQTT